MTACDFSFRELRKAIEGMSDTTERGDIPVEVFQAVAMETDPSLQRLFDLCNHCWREKVIPPERSTTSVATLYKKETLQMPTVTDQYLYGYKLFAALSGSTCSLQLLKTDFGDHNSASERVSLNKMQFSCVTKD